MTEIVELARRIVHCDHHDPFEVLGPHLVDTPSGRRLCIRVYEPSAREIYVVDRAERARTHAMKPAFEPGFFEYTFDDARESCDYELRAVYEDGRGKTWTDPYATPVDLPGEELCLFNQGVDHEVYRKLGAHPCTCGGVAGVRFAVWAPNARHVSVIGDWNAWDGRYHGMKVIGSSGVWALFVPGVEPGAVYKYEIKTREGHLYQKADPYAFASELRPCTASVVADLSRHEWRDDAWMARRRATDILNQPISIYEVHLGSWMRDPGDPERFLTYRELADKLVEHVGTLGATHIELLPVAEHPLDISWGYQVLGYYAPTARYGTPEEFMEFVDEMHRHGIGVLMDWVPAHFPRDEHGLAYFDGTFLYEHDDVRMREHKDWGTLIFNYGRNEVRSFLTANAIFWFDRYHLDGLRVDAVASMLYRDYSRLPGEWTPNRDGGRENYEAIDFLKKLNEAVFERFPGVMMVAEESTAWPQVSRPTSKGGLGFNFKWNMGWMNDFLTYMSKDPIHRKYHQDLITFALLYAFHENFILVLSHDEVSHLKKALLDKMPGDMWQKFANLRSLLAFMFGHPGKKLLFMGTEIAPWNEWNCSQSLDWHLLDHEPHKKMSRFMTDLNHLYRAHRALWEQDYGWEGFEWIDFNDRDNSVISFVRWAKNHEECVVFVCNFTPIPRPDYRVGMPMGGRYRKIMDTDSEQYWGSNAFTETEYETEEVSWHGRTASIALNLPPLATILLVPEPRTTEPTIPD